MKRPPVIDNRTKNLQAKASTPKNSAWVSANAGSGKTHVLTQRVVRLLLSGVKPSRILCLTYTNAAAGEMSNRVFETLGGWVGLPTQDLIDELAEIERRDPSPHQVERARMLFAQALETPGGLKIQTIHAFCEALLHQFPLEANVPASFSVLDEAGQRQMIASARRDLAVEAGANPDSPVGRAFLDLMGLASDAQLEKALEEVVARREELSNWLHRIGGPSATNNLAKVSLGFEVEDNIASLMATAIAGSFFETIDCRHVADLCLATGEAKAADIARNLRSYADTDDATNKAEIISALVLTKKGHPLSFAKYPSNAVEAAVPGIREYLAGEAERWMAALGRISEMRLIEATQPLLVVADFILGHYHRAKRQRGLLDFDDLIERTRHLLSRSDARSWVLYKLDLGIDHILLDEAQDTSPEQWDIVSALADEFFAGESARQANRTVFAVGDEKQSIYSFRGAEPRNFATQRNRYERQAKLAQHDFCHVDLGLSFRSTIDVLGAVDSVFSIPENAAGVTFVEPPPAHTSARPNDPGSVEVWGLIEPSQGDDPPDWHTPTEFVGRHQADLLAREIATQLGQWIGSETISSTGEPITAGDILVLVRSRDRFVTALTRELKSRKIAVAGADRLTITDHIAVKDLLAIGQVALTPGDDLTLAVVLKSPMIGVSEEELYELSQSRFRGDREISLFEALQEAQDTVFRDAGKLIQRWQYLAGQLPVFEFFAQILGAMGGRSKFFARLGGEAEDVLDAFLDAALMHEREGLPGLQAFIDALREDAPEIKREMDRSAGEVRIMTVHAAKGLEAPIVFLVDKCSAAFQGQHAPALYCWPEGKMDDIYLWVPEAKLHSPTTRRLRGEQQRRAEEEYRRLLYVGMTRAEDRLIVCGYRGSRNPPSPNWHAMVSSALAPDWVNVDCEDGNPIRRRWQARNTPPEPGFVRQKVADAGLGRSVTLPDWIHHRLPRESMLPRPLNPSGAQAIIDEKRVDSNAVMSPFAERGSPKKGSMNPRKRGTLIHRLLQHLPDIDEEEWSSSARSFLERHAPEVDAGAREYLVNVILMTLRSPQLTGCFDAEHSVAEVPVMGTIQLSDGPRAVSGTIDRLAVLSQEVVIVDFKTGRQIPGDENSIPPDHVMQMALYRALVAPIYPRKPVRCLIVWTHAADSPLVLQVPAVGMDAVMKEIAPH